MKRVRIRYKRVLILLVIIIVVVLIVLGFLGIRISNIYVSGNDFFNDQYIIESARIDDYPKSIFNSSGVIKKRLENDTYISGAIVKKKGLKEVHIDVVENRPLYYDSISNYIVLMNKENSAKVFNVPILVNKVDSGIYDKFISKLSDVDVSVLSFISEIKYSPNDVDKELFVFTMNDGNYIFVNLNKFSSVNRYFDMVVNFNNHRGILYLDSGEYFKILDN